MQFRFWRTLGGKRQQFLMPLVFGLMLSPLAAIAQDGKAEGMQGSAEDELEELPVVPAEVPRGDAAAAKGSSQSHEPAKAHRYSVWGGVGLGKELSDSRVLARWNGGVDMTMGTAPDSLRIGYMAALASPISSAGTNDRAKASLMMSHYLPYVRWSSSFLPVLMHGGVALVMQRYGRKEGGDSDHMDMKGTETLFSPLLNIGVEKEWRIDEEMLGGWEFSYEFIARSRGSQAGEERGKSLLLLGTFMRFGELGAKHAFMMRN